MTELKFLIVSMRPNQWVKNVLIFAAIVFSRNLLNVTMLCKTIGAFWIFCGCSGSVYIINDLLDIHADRMHPLKRHRPLASGNLRKSTALFGVVVIMVCSLFIGWLLSRSFFIVCLFYLVLQLCYSFILKRVVILDVFSIACGFVLRVIGGVEVIHVPMSSWLLICTVLLSLFLALSKRRHELILLDEKATKHRMILQEYSPYLLDQMIAVVTSATVIAYALYTIAPETVEKFHTTHLIYTVPFILYGIFRYLYLMHQKNEGGNPEKVLVTDVPLLINILLYTLAVIGILYR
ncbi:MAG: decaprenyl-phosphate phosphoribosyltransferase [bacterium]